MIPVLFVVANAQGLKKKTVHIPRHLNQKLQCLINVATVHVFQAE